VFVLVTVSVLVCFPTVWCDPALRDERVRRRMPAGCNRYLRDAVQQWAFCSLTRSGWARQFYDRHIADHHSHHAALRALGNRWLEVLWHCLTRGVRYDEAIHTANRNAAMAHPRAA